MPDHDVTFTVEDGHLARSVRSSTGEPYKHRCTLANYEAVAHAVAAIGDEGFTNESLVARLEGGTDAVVPWSQVGVALAFMKERGCVVPLPGRRHKAASTFVHADAMTEYHALRDGIGGAT